MASLDTPRKRAFVQLEGRDFLHPYLKAEFEPVYSLEIVRQLPDDAPEDAVRVCIAGENDTLPETDAPVLAVPEVIGTGMTGMPRRLAEDVAAGRFYLIRDTDYPRIRILHATDLASAARIAAERGTSGIWSLDDGKNPTLNELADALAYRMNGKRLFALPRKWARLFGIGRKWMRHNCAPARFTSFAESAGFRPNSVCEYLRTHVYDENSL
ncbi:MAG: hypothetical protein K2L96_01490 [Muribaculaceae bacterium]|nr:hypothetical protein [Muribaculaceae bacterium]